MASPGKSAAVKAPEPPAELVREPLVLNNRPLGWITDAIAGVCEKPMPVWW